MNKNLLKELILPFFWLFFFIVYAKDGDNSKLKNERDIAIRIQQEKSAAGPNDHTTGQNKGTKSTNAVFLAGF